MKKIRLITIALFLTFISGSLFAQYDKIYPIGSATEAGWTIQDCDSMTVDPENSTLFTWEDTLMNGEIKFETNITDWCMGDEIIATAENQVLTATDYQIRVDCEATDNKWVVDVPGVYSITLDLTAETIVYTLVEEITVEQDPYTELYMIGDATTAAWDIASPLPFTQDSENDLLFTWEGPLTANIFKITTYSGEWCDGDELVPTVDNQVLTATDFTYNLTCGGPDNKWLVDVAGTYLITVDLENETISIELQVGIEDEAAKSQVAVYPNPASDMLNIEVGENTDATISMFSIDGRRLYNKAAVEGTTRVDLNSINAAGIVIVKVASKNLTEVFRIVVE